MNPVEIDLCYFPICIITHNNNEFNKTLTYSRSKFCPQKSPIDQQEENAWFFSQALSTSSLLTKEMFSDWILGLTIND